MDDDGQEPQQQPEEPAIIVPIEEVVASTYNQVRGLVKLMNFVIGTLLANGAITAEDMKGWDQEKNDEYLLRLTALVMEKEREQADDERKA